MSSTKYQRVWRNFTIEELLKFVLFTNLITSVTETRRVRSAEHLISKAYKIVDRRLQGRSLKKPVLSALQRKISHDTCITRFCLLNYSVKPRYLPKHNT